MKKNLLFSFVLVFAFVFLQSPVLSNDNDVFWISYTGFPTQPDASGPPGGPKFLLKIDFLGNIVIGPKRMVVNSSVYVSPLGGATALSSSPTGRLQLWFPSKKSISNHQIFKAVIDKENLRLLSMGPTKLRTHNTNRIQVSQKVPGGNLAVENLLFIESASLPAIDNQLIGYSTLDLDVKLFSQDCLTSDCTFGVSSDGRVLFYAKQAWSRSELLFQRLGPRGLPVDDPIVIERGRDAVAYDVSGPISDGKRYLIYAIAQSTFLQVVDAKSGQKIGTRIRIGPDLGASQNLAIDPRGRFVVYESLNRTIKGQFLLYQALDAIGRLSGLPKTLAEGTGGGLDILKDGAN